LALLALKGALRDFWICYYEFNMQYIKSSGTSFNVAKVFLEFAKQDANIPVSISALVLLLFYPEPPQKKGLIFGNMYFAQLFALIISFMVIVLSGRWYYHYIATLIPLFCAPLAALANASGKFENGGICFKTILIGLVATLGISFKNNILNISTIVVDTFAVDWRTAIVEAVQRNSEPDEKILVLGYNTNIYVYSERASSSKFMYQPYGIAPDIISPEIIAENVRTEKPVLVVVPESYNLEYYYPVIRDELNSYTHIESQSGYLLYKRIDGAAAL
jgi:hypothetical protein